MKKIAADGNYRIFIKKAEEMKGYKLVSSERYERDHILGHYKTKESAVRGGYRWVVMENKREVEELELGNYDGTPYTLSQKKMYYDPWKISKINIEEGIFDASNSMRDVYVMEYSYSTDITDPGDIDLSENDEYVNYFNVDTTPEEGEEFNHREGMGRRPKISGAVDGETRTMYR